MRALVQRVLSASVTIDGALVGQIDRGLLVYVGVGHGDGESTADALAEKIRYLRIFEDAAGKMNLDILQVGGGILAISSFSLWADTRKGRRPAFTDAAPPDVAAPLYRRFCESMRGLGLRVEMGRFQETMAVTSVNDGPINILVDVSSLG